MVQYSTYRRIDIGKDSDAGCLMLPLSMSRTGTVNC